MVYIVHEQFAAKKEVVCCYSFPISCIQNWVVSMVLHSTSAQRDTLSLLKEHRRYMLGSPTKDLVLSCNSHTFTKWGAACGLNFHLILYWTKCSSIIPRFHAATYQFDSWSAKKGVYSVKERKEYVQPIAKSVEASVIFVGNFACLEPLEPLSVLFFFGIWKVCSAVCSLLNLRVLFKPKSSRFAVCTCQNNVSDMFKPSGNLFLCSFCEKNSTTGCFRWNVMECFNLKSNWI